MWMTARRKLLHEVLTAASTPCSVPVMDPTQYFQSYVRRVGGRAEAAKRLGIGAGMVGHIVCGRRAISAKVAMAIDADTRGEICKAWLRPDLWDVSDCLPPKTL